MFELLSVGKFDSMDSVFKIESSFGLEGDQPKAVDALVEGLKAGKREQVLFGITGSGKTFSMANIIERMGRPAVVFAHNKTLAMQLYEEMKEFFPNNAVEYFVSYYDYYQPEAYIPGKDLYLEKDAVINEQIETMRHSATRSLFERRDVIIVASVSCIYGLGAPEEYSAAKFEISVGHQGRTELIQKFIGLQYKRNDMEPQRGNFRVKGNVMDIFPAHLSERGWKIVFDGETIESITEFDSITAEKFAVLDRIAVYPNTHYIISPRAIKQVVEEIKRDMRATEQSFIAQGKLLEAQRIKQRTEYDIEMMLETGTCKGIENFSRYFSNRKPGEPPPTLFEYLPKDALLFVDESHVTVPQIGGMFNGDRARKENLVQHGFRLPAAFDNRPLKLEEWESLRPQTIFVSATPGKYELGLTRGECVEQIIRPTGLVDPICEIKPAATQVNDLLHEIKAYASKKQRALVTTLTKKTAEHLAEYLADNKVKAAYLHSEIKTLDRALIIKSLRRGDIDAIIGVNLLREGLDIPECALVAVLDADQAGFLRSETSLIQIIGRAARNLDGRVILYADKVTDAMKKAMDETARRRKLQLEYNTKHSVTAQTIQKFIAEATAADNAALAKTDRSKPEGAATADKFERNIKALKKLMFKEAADFNFEKAAQIRDQIRKLTGEAMRIL